MSSNKLLSCLDLSIGHSQDLPLFSKVNLNLFSGDVVCIMGANGVGKSTFLKTISGELAPLFGQVYLQQKELRDYSEKERACLLSIVQSSVPNFHPGLKVREILEFSRSPYTSFWGSLKKADHEIIAETLSRLEIVHLKERELSVLSDGQRQKVMIARSLVQQTPLILLDEPTTFLDLKNQISVLLLLKRLASEFKKTIVFTSHHWELILELATKVWYFDETTKSISETSPEDLILTQKWQDYLNLDVAQFDTLDGRFKLSACEAYPIGLKGELDSVQTKWTAHYLMKHGFYLNPTAKTVCHFQSGKWTIESEARSEVAASLLELGEKLKSLLV